jgi:hypothetical protein
VVVRRLCAAVAVVLAGGVAASASGGSVVAPLLVRGQIDIEGVGCGVPASADLTLPAGVTDVRVRTPAVGARDGDAQITNVAVGTGAVTFTAVADGDATCNPDSGSTPPAERRWSALFDAEIAAKQATPVAVRTDWLLHGRFALRPRIVGVSSGPGLAANDTVRHVRWKSFGGRKAVGFGTFRLRHFFCPSRNRCGAEDGQPVRVELTRPGYCPPDNVLDAGVPVGRFVFYGKIAVYNRRRIGVLKPGTEFQSYKPECFPGKPVRLR